MTGNELIDKYKNLNVEVKAIPNRLVEVSATYFVGKDEFYYCVRGNVDFDEVDKELNKIQQSL